MLETDPDHVSLQPDNAIIVPKWKGEPNDKGLIATIPFLECELNMPCRHNILIVFPAIAIYKPPDVRPLLKAYHGKDIPIEYAKQEALAKERFLEDWKKSGKAKTGGGLTLSGLFAGSSSQDKSPVPLTYLEQKRKDAQAHYLEELEYIKANKEQFDKLLEEDRKAAEAQMSGNLFSILGNLTGPPPGMPPPPKPDDAAVTTVTAPDGKKASGTSALGLFKS